MAVALGPKFQSSKVPRFKTDCRLAVSKRFSTHPWPRSMRNRARAQVALVTRVAVVVS